MDNLRIQLSHDMTFSGKSACANRRVDVVTIQCCRYIFGEEQIAEVPNRLLELSSQRQVNNNFSTVKGKSTICEARSDVCGLHLVILHLLHLNNRHKLKAASLLATHMREARPAEGLRASRGLKCPRWQAPYNHSTVVSSSSFSIVGGHKDEDSLLFLDCYRAWYCSSTTTRQPVLDIVVS